MNRLESEMILVGGGFVLAPVVACVVAVPWFMVTREPLLPIISGTVVGMGVYIGGCWLHSRCHPNSTETDEAGAAEKDTNAVESSGQKQ